MQNSAKMVQLFKGGSLSQTSLMLVSGKYIVRKSVDFSQNREYGYQRWFSQLKRLQRYENLYPGMFPKILSCGVVNNIAYYDMEYIENSVNLYTYLQNASINEVQVIVDAIFKQLNTLHINPIPFLNGAISSYISEEINRPIDICSKNPIIADLFYSEYIWVNGRKIKPISKNIDEFISNLLSKSDLLKEACINHGNPTIENMMIVPNNPPRIFFIDPYEECAIDGAAIDYSQILQSVHGKYEVLMSKIPKVDNKSVSTKIDTPEAYSKFCLSVSNKIKTKLSDSEWELVLLLEVSQFIRMLPFKLSNDEDAGRLFFMHASELFDRILHNRIDKEL